MSQISSDTQPPVAAPTAEKPRLWASRRYVTWLISDTTKGLAGTLFSFAIPLITLFVTNDPTKAGILGGIGMGVTLVTILAGGVIADRYPRVLMMILGGAIGTALSLIFAILAWINFLPFWVLIAFEVLMALRSGLFNVAGEAALKEIVPSELMGTAQAANQGRDAALQLAGGPIGGVLLGVGTWLVGLVMALSHLISTATAFMLGVRQPQRGNTASTQLSDAEISSPAEDKTSVFQEIREGFAWLFSRADLRGVLIISTLINLAFNTATTTAIYSLQQDGYSTVAIGSISTVLGVAMLAGAVSAPFFVSKVGSGILAITGLLFSTLSIAAVSSAHTPLTVAATFGCGVLLIPILNSGLLGYFMVAVPTELLGRANSASSFVSMGAMPLAPLIAGFGLVHLGRAHTLLICAGFAITATLLAFFNRSLRELPKQSGWEEYSTRFARS